MAIQNQPTRIAEPFAGSGTKNTIPATNTAPTASQAASWASGFPPECSQPISAGGCPVPRNDFNGVLNQLSQDYAFRQDGGVWEWSASADYPASRAVLGSDGKLYFSKSASGPSSGAGAKNPVSDSGTYWTRISTDDAGVVHVAGAEKISGAKTFSSDVTLEAADPAVIFKSTSQSPVVNSATIQSISGNILRLRAFNAGTAKSYITLNASQGSIHFGADDAAANGCFLSSAYAALHPEVNNTLTLGMDGYRWKEVFAVQGSINTSDQRLKTEPEAVPDEVLDAWGDVGFVQFQMLDAVAKKGADKARLHSGLIAQRIGEAFKAHGLDASRYGLFCHDSWPAQAEVRDKDGGVAVPGRKAGDEFSLRYEEALCMEAAYQRRRADRAEARLAAIEDRLAAIEAKLNAQP